MRLRGALVTVTALAVLTAGCAGEDPPESATAPDDVVATATSPEEAEPEEAESEEAVEGCAAEEHPPLQAGSHLIGDADPPVPYSSNPPTSGWHASGRPETGVHDEPLTDPEIVSLLEGGQVVAVYDPDALPRDAVAELEELATASHGGRLSVTPANTALPAPLTLAAWGVLQRCDVVSAEAVTTFVLTHYGRTEEGS